MTTESETLLHIKEFQPEMLFPSTDDMHKKEAWGTKMVVIGRPECFERNTLILMFNGSVKYVQDIKVGDVVMGDDSTPRNVLSLSQGRDTMYKITPKIGESVVVNKNHVITIIKIKGNNRGQIIDIPVHSFMNMSPKIKATYNWIRTPVEFPKCHQKIDPYIIGYFVDGDYSFIKREFIKCHFDTSDSTIDKLIEKNIPRIPNHIMYSSIDDRAQYLAGMLDARSTYNSITKRFDMPLSTEELCDQVMFLAGSIGYYTSKIKNYKSNFFTQTHQLIWSCYIYVNSNTLLPSKIFDINYIKTVFGGIFTTDFYITEQEEGEYFGFGIDGNQRFLLGDFSVTHNSGKCMGKDTPVVMYDGSIRPIQDIAVNDEVMGDDSTPRRVLQLYSGVDQLYRVKQILGEDYIVNSQHILTVCDNNDKIVDVPVLDIDPKVHYGVKAKLDFPSAAVAENAYDYGFSILGKDQRIDMSYVINDTKCRLTFLAGFLDACAVYDAQAHAFHIPVLQPFDSTILFLARSLGFYTFNPARDKRQSTNKYILYGPCEKVPCKILTITDNVSNSTTASSHVKTSIKIIPHEHGEYFGFELDGNRRYVLGDCTITHNTYAIKSLLYQKRHIFPVGMVFSGSEQASGQWSSVFPSTFVYNRLRTDKMQDFLQRQILARKHLVNPWAVLLMDDCGYDGKHLKNEVFKEIFQNGRHYKMWFILSLQHAADILPSLRTCIDYTFIYRENNYNNRRRIYENYASIIPTFGMFCSIMDQVHAEKYTALVINNLASSNELQDSIFWYKAAPFPSDFKFGSLEYWKYHYVRYQDKENPNA